MGTSPCHLAVTPALRKRGFCAFPLPASDTGPTSALMGMRPPCSWPPSPPWGARAWSADIPDRGTEGRPQAGGPRKTSSSSNLSFFWFQQQVNARPVCGLRSRSREQSLLALALGLHASDPSDPCSDALPRGSGLQGSDPQGVLAPPAANSHSVHTPPVAQRRTPGQAQGRDHGVVSAVSRPPVSWGCARQTPPRQHVAEGVRHPSHPQNTCSLLFR